MTTARTKSLIAALAFMALPHPALAAAGTDSPYVTQLRTTAESGNAEAQYNLGNAYLLGIGVQKDSAEALRWISNSANQGNARAESALGRIYQEGMGVQKDDSEALRWFRKAAEQNNADAQDLLGFAYLLGDGVRTNYVEAYKWFSVAASNGDAHARKDRDSVKQYMSAEMVDQGDQLVKQWQEVHSTAPQQGLVLVSIK